MTLSEVFIILAKAVILMLSVSFVVLLLTYAERKALARIQQRMGPTRVGFRGILQPVADALKLITKEDILPTWADKGIYWLAPIAVFVPAFLMWVTIPVAQQVVGENLDLGLLYIVAVSVLSVLGLVMAGWGSANKWAVMGGLRAAGQLISYEIPFIMAILGVVMLAQSLDLTEVVTQQNSVPFALVQPLGLFIFLTSALAELGRTPFDIHHAESEVVGGPFVEYSGAHWSIFFLAEYMNTFTIAVLTVLLFLGGWSWPIMPFDGFLHTTLSAIWLLLKTSAVIWLIFWIRGTYPRLRIDQLMAFGWKMLVPLSFLNILMTAIVLFYSIPLWVLTCLSGIFLIATVYIIRFSASSSMKRETIRLISAKELRSKVGISPLETGGKPE